MRRRNAPHGCDIGPADGGVVGAHWSDGLELARFFVVGRVLGARCRFYALHDKRGDYIGLTGRDEMRSVGTNVGTDLVTGVDDDVRATEEPGDGTRVGVEEALLGLWHAVAAPVDLDELD